MRKLVSLLFIFSLSAQAQSLLPIPQAPSTPTLPLPINTDGYFVFSWPSDTRGTQQSIVTTNPPVEVRSGVVKVGTWSYGTWFLKSNGEVVLYFNQGGAGAAPTKVNLPSFFKTNISQFYLQGSAPPALMVGVSSSGQMGVMTDTNISSFYQPVGGTNVVEALIRSEIGPEGFISLHSDGKIRCWSVENTNISITNHITSQLENVKSIDGTAACGLAISEGGQVYGWNSATQLLPIPFAASSGVVQVSAPLNAAGTPLFYALKNDGSIIYWDLQGSQFLLPASFTGKQFIQVLGIEDDLAFALTRAGEIVGWRRLSDGTLETLSLPASLSSGINQIKWTFDNMGRKRIVALNNQGGILPVSDLGASGWGVDGSVPFSIASRGGTLNSIVLGSGGGATGPSNYALSTDGDLAVQTYAGLPLDVLAKLVAERIVGTPSNYGLSTQSSINSQVSNSLTQMVSATLATKTELSNSLTQSRTDGINSVISNPNLWTLYTTNQIKAMVMGDLMLTRTNNGQFVLNYDIEQSDDLSNWAPYAGYALPLTNLPTDKAFVRIKLKNQQ